MNKKALKQQYKQEARPAGVFQIRNTVNGKVQVAGTMNLDGSRNRFSFEQKVGSVTKNRALQEEWKEFGADAFVFEVLEELEARDDTEADRRADVEVLEALWIEKLQPFGDRGYNSPPKA
jgi:hypothetical protein